MDALDLNMIDVCDVKEAGTSAVESNSSTKSLKDSTTDIIRSRAIVTYSSAKYPALFSQLAPFTNLNLAPSNWLRQAPGLRPSIMLSGSRASSLYNTNDQPLFSSFQMADSHLKLIGDIDMISDAENLKKLLKVPYSKAHVSMAVHRIGNTLLLEHFDVHHDSLKSHGWKWFQDMYKQLTQKDILRKKLPSAQHERLMMSKFLYHSVRDDSGASLPPDGMFSNSSCVNIEELPPVKEQLHPSVEGCSLKAWQPSPDASIIPAEVRWKYWTPDDASTSQCYDIRRTFERTIFWTFEDLEMLLGTNMPIFGGGEYPAVSLRLLDSNKPINILTGIDYWLDNLICNVPEVVMCFHVNGIVQKYEVIKTEEIPKLTSPKFSPHVIKDIAQNILSFLKSNCTKEGHTYWLFKGSGDDVVKLYDLTSLCTTDSSSQSHGNSSHNPFTISVATLLYKMAVRLMKQASVASKKQSDTIKKLLLNCIRLLEKQTEVAPVMLDAALCMLSTLCLPDSIDVEIDGSSKSSKPRSYSVSSSVSEPNDSSIDNASDLNKAEVAVISSVNDLSIPEKFKANTPTCIDKSVEDTDSYAMALSYIVKGLDVFQRFSSWGKEPPLDGNCHDLLLVHMQMIRNTTLIYYALAKHSFSGGKYGKSLHCIKVALSSYEYLEQLVDMHQKIKKDAEAKNDYDIAAVLQKMAPPDFNLLLPQLLALCGEIHMMHCHWSSEKKVSFHLEYEVNCQKDIIIVSTLEKNFSGVGDKYKSALLIQTNYDDILKSCRNCFEMALNHLIADASISGKQAQIGPYKSKDKKAKDSAKTMESSAVLQLSLNRKLGHVANEQGAFYLDKAVQLLLVAAKSESHIEEEKKLWKLTFGHFEFALKCFTEVNDLVNQAVVLSNLGRLMRICAQSTAQKENDKFTLHEQQLYDSAIDYYKKALAVQKQTSKRKQLNLNTNKHLPVVADNISWEISGAYFTMAQRLQDHPPLDIKAQSDIEKLVMDLLNKSLKSCSDIWIKTEKRMQAIYQCAKIHSRLASLYHNSCLQAVDLNKKRQFRSLADAQYEKACLFFSSLSDAQMCEYLRVILERLAMREQQLPYLSNNSTKLKLILEGINVMILCERPLKTLSKLLSENIELIKTCESTPVDPQAYSDNDVSEWKSLIEILSTIVKSFLLTLLKLTAPQSNNASNSKKKFQNIQKTSLLEHSHYKQIYSKTLRLFQQADGLDSPVQRKFVLSSLLHKGNALLQVISDLK